MVHSIPDINLSRQIIDRHLNPKESLNFTQVYDFVNTITSSARGKEHVLAIIFYGSCLSPGMQRASSTPDYFVIVDSYFGFYGKKRHALLNRYLQPNIYRYRDSKYSVISLADLMIETSANAHDVYIMGRFSKRLALCYFKDLPCRESLVAACAGAVYEVLRRSLALFRGETTLDQIILMALKLSYLGEMRVEAEDKIQTIFQANANYYRELYGCLLSSLTTELTWLKPFTRATSKMVVSYDIQPPNSARAAALRFIRKSRIRSCLRWPKFALTIENWIDYIIAKIERTNGIQINLTERERRWILFASWKYIWRLRRRNILK